MTTWAYGVTTVPERIDSGLTKQTLDSLANAGFHRPRIFIDGKPTDTSSLGTLEKTIHVPPLRTFGNWWATALELYLRQPRADRYAIFQDDFITYRNLRRYLESCTYPSNGYWNLYLFPENKIEGKTGWYNSPLNNGKGAVATVFDNATLRHVMTYQSFVDKPMSKTKSHSSVDGAIVTVMRKTNRLEYVHNPSLVQHTGKVSSMGNKIHPTADTFLGAAFDALELMSDSPIRPNEKYLGDNIEGALALIGITSERIEKFLGVEDCGCSKRKEKLNSIHRWAKRVLGGKLENAEKHLEEITTCEPNTTSKT